VAPPPNEVVDRVVSEVREQNPDDALRHMPSYACERAASLATCQRQQATAYTRWRMARPGGLSSGSRQPRRLTPAGQRPVRLEVAVLITPRWSQVRRLRRTTELLGRALVRASRGTPDEARRRRCCSRQ
jgi:hypothetical protein